MSDTPQVLPQHHLRKLKLPTFQSEHAKLARQCATEGKDHVQYLLRLCELELIERERERRMIERRIKAAKFPATKSLDSFDFKVIPSINKVLAMELARCAFVDRRENVIALGPSGTGKTHVALGLGLAACQKGRKVGFTTAAAQLRAPLDAAPVSSFSNASPSRTRPMRSRTGFAIRRSSLFCKPMPNLAHSAADPVPTFCPSSHPGANGKRLRSMLRRSRCGLEWRSRRRASPTATSPTASPRCSRSKA